MIPCPSCGTLLARRKVVGDVCACGYFMRSAVSGFLSYGIGEHHVTYIGDFYEGRHSPACFEAVRTDGTLAEVEIPSEDVPDAVARISSEIRVRKIMES